MDYVCVGLGTYSLRPDPLIKTATSPPTGLVGIPPFCRVILNIFIMSFVKQFVNITDKKTGETKEVSKLSQDIRNSEQKCFAEIQILQERGEYTVLLCEKKDGSVMTGFLPKSWEGVLPTVGKQVLFSFAEDKWWVESY